LWYTEAIRRRPHRLRTHADVAKPIAFATLGSTSGVASGDLPDGQFCDLAVLVVQPFGKKYFAFLVGQIKFTTRPIPPR
jgi:hypothetical protein